MKGHYCTLSELISSARRIGEEVISVKAELRASLEELMDDCSREVGRLEEMRRALGQVSATAERSDGLVTVVVGPRGQVQDIRFDPKAYRKLSPGELSSAIMQLIAVATADVSGQTEKIMAPFLPAGLSYEQVLGAKGDFTALRPQPPTRSKDEPDIPDRREEG
jgi:DNA-binding protein YbaB